MLDRDAVKVKGGHSRDFLHCALRALMEANHAGYIDCGSAELVDGARDVTEPDADGLGHMDVLFRFDSTWS